MTQSEHERILRLEETIPNLQERVESLAEVVNNLALAIEGAPGLTFGTARPAAPVFVNPSLFLGSAEELFASGVTIADEKGLTAKCWNTEEKEMELATCELRRGKYFLTVTSRGECPVIAKWQGFSTHLLKVDRKDSSRVVPIFASRSTNILCIVCGGKGENDQAKSCSADYKLTAV